MIAIMWRLVLIVAIFVFLPLYGYCQSEDEMLKIAEFLGVTSMEDLSDEEVERYADLMRSPLKINVASRSKLLSCGLFTSYQVATLLEHKRRTGMILSISELASIDGFGPGYVETIRPFISVQAPMNSEALLPAGGKTYQELSVRGGYRYTSSEHQWQYGLKYGIDAGSALKFSLGFSRGLSNNAPYPSAYTLSASYEFKKIVARVILGDFNARFGQGLVAWNGTFLNSLTSPSGFMKKASGVSSVRSFTGSAANTGVASEFNFGRLSVSAALALPGLKEAKFAISPIVNMRWYNRIGSIGLTSVLESNLQNQASVRTSSSLDASLCIKGVNLFAEAAYDWILRKLSAVAGTDFTLKERMRIAALGGWKQGNQWQFATSGNLVLGENKSHSITASSELLYYLTPKDKSESKSIQVKSQLYWEWQTAHHLILRLKVSDRFRTWGQPHRTELRSELSLPLGTWNLGTRMCVLKCRNHALLGHLDASYKINSMTLHLRVGSFMVDHWDDRIYVYEYDAPGSFNVPAYYGRGVWLSAVLSCRIKRYLKLYFRTSYIDYPFMSEQNKKPGRAELKVQSVFRF